MSDLPTTVATDLPKAADPRGMHRPQPIAFSCSNGHRIVVDAALAGKKGRCKECKEIVTIPMPATRPGVAAVPPAKEVAPRPPVQAAGDGESRALHRAPADGPSLIINEPPPPPPRQLPTAGKMLIGEPLIEGESAMAGLSIDPMEVQIHSADGTQGDAPPAADGRPTEEQQLIDEGAGGAGVIANPTARLMERLWYERRHGGVIEVHLTGAVSPILPTYFYPRWSDGSHGLFASIAAEGTVTLTAVAWDSVQKIVVRHVDSIPPDFLDIGLDE
ncbi:MAG: hypothetical protein ACO3NZ_08640 [Pirellulales bacterium]|jgi:hypothetical protein